MAMLVRDFLPKLARRYGLARGPEGLVGWSMGGYGALLAAEEHPVRFAAVAATSPAIFRRTTRCAPDRATRSIRRTTSRRTT
jgi:enterochelin esterase-like enzyme